MKPETIVSLKSITIKDFKNIEKQEYLLKDLNEFYGSNRTGKSSVLDALRFVFYGGKNDTDKIQVGKDKCEVEVSLEENGVPMKIITSLDRKGKLKCTAIIKGVKSNNPRSLIKRMISFGTFNPREMLDKENRQERLLKLVPIYIKKEDVVIPDDGRPFPIHDPNSIDYAKHAFVVLQDVYKDMYNVRKDLNRERDIFKKSHAEREREYNENSITFQKNYGMLPKEAGESLEEASAKVGKIKESKNSIEKSLKEQRSILEDNENKITDNEAKINTFNKKIDECMKSIEKMESEIKGIRSVEELPKKQVESAKEKIKKLEGEYASFGSRVAEAEKKVAIARQVSRLRDESEGVKKAHDQFKKKNAEWEVMEALLKKHWPIFVNKTLKPIEDKVPGLKVGEGGKFSYEGTPLDELSGQETISLGLKLFRMGAKSNLITIDEFENVDEKNIEGLDLKGLNVLVARVAKSPIGENWNSIKMDEKTGGKDVTEKKSS